MSDALREASEQQRDAAALGFDWPDARGAMMKLREEVDELDRAMSRGDQGEIHDEFGDVLFSAVNVSRFLAVDASESLRASTRKFSGRFEKVKDEMRRRGRRVEECSLAELDAVWDEIKGHETSGTRPVQ